MAKLCVILVALAIVYTVVSLECGPNAVESDCIPCDQFCNSEPTACILSVNCTGGPYCACPIGYLRVSNSISDGCAQLDDCPISIECGPNEVVTECIPCDRLCNSQPKACITACNKKDAPYCRCESGYMRIPNGTSKGCVLPEDCPSSSE